MVLAVMNPAISIESSMSKNLLLQIQAPGEVFSCKTGITLLVNYRCPFSYENISPHSHRKISYNLLYYQILSRESQASTHDRRSLTGYNRRCQLMESNMFNVLILYHVGKTLILRGFIQVQQYSSCRTLETGMIGHRTKTSRISLSELRGATPAS